jgi:hypothetical protein
MWGRGPAQRKQIYFKKVFRIYEIIEEARPTFLLPTVNLGLVSIKYKSRIGHTKILSFHSWENIF